MAIVINSNVNDALKGLLNKVENPLENEPSYQHLVKADALRIKNHFWDSIEEYLAAIQLDDTNIDAFTGLGLAYKQLGLAKSAISAFDKAKKLNPFGKSLYFETGCCYCIDKNYKKAIKEFKNALKLCPEYLESRYNLALAYEMNYQYALSIKEYKKIIENHPDFAKAYNNLGSLYMQLEDYYASIDIFRKLLKINPQVSRAYLGVAICLDKIGNKTKAARYYKNYLKFKPVSEDVPHIIDRIYEIKKETPSSNKRSHLMLVS